MPTNNIKPRVNPNGLVERELEGELLIYNTVSDRVYCLNGTAAQVYKYADGNRTVQEIAHAMRQELNAPVDDAIVRYGLLQLSKSGLLDEAIAPYAEQEFTSRRKVLAKLGAGAAILAIPVIAAIVAPDAAHASSDPCAPATGRPTGCPCTFPSQCTADICSGGACILS